MFPLFQNPVVSNEHECRDLPLPAVLHTENCRGRMKKRGLGVAKIIQCVYSSHHDDSSDGTESRRQGRNHGSQQVHTAGG